MNLAQQLQTAGAHAQRLAASEAELTAQQRQRIQRIAETRQANGSGKYTGTGLKEALIAQLPVGIENAVTNAEIRELLTGVTFAEKGLSSALSVLIERGDIRRTGSKSKFRYYKEAA